MKSPVIFQNKKEKSQKQNKKREAGFLVMEALIALALLSLLVPAALFLSWSNGKLKIAAQSRLGSLASATDLIENGATYQMASSSLLYQHEFGRSTCSLVPQDQNKGFVGADIYTAGAIGAALNFTPNAVGTFVAAHNGFVYETTKPVSKSSPDFFIIDDRNLALPVMISSLVTGPGLAAVAVSGYYAYAANESSISQMRIIDIHDRTHPTVVSQLKLPVPNASTTEPLASSIFYDDGVLYLGTQKWNGDEFAVIDVSNPLSPFYVNGFDTGSLVNSIYENGGYVYLATPSTDAQMDILDIRNPQSIVDDSHFAPAGSAVLEGKAFAYDGGIGNASGNFFETAVATGTLYFARAGGGFNNTSQYELFSFNLAHDPYAQNPTFVRDIPGGVYGIVYADGYLFLATGDSNAGFQIWKSDFSKEVYSATLPSKPVSLACDHDRLYAALSNPAGFAAIVPR
jgi:hypothetical protein